MPEPSTTEPTQIHFTHWPLATHHTPIFRSDSAEAIETGRHHLFDPVECCRMGRCS